MTGFTPLLPPRRSDAETWKNQKSQRRQLIFSNQLNTFWQQEDKLG
jgi:hypothetical protein